MDIITILCIISTCNKMRRVCYKMNRTFNLSELPSWLHTSYLFMWLPKRKSPYYFYNIGVPEPVSQVDVNIRGNIVVFNWTYNNSVNGVPATEYVITVVRTGTNLVSASDTIPISQMNYTITVEELLSFRNHSVSLVVRNMQGDSEEISNRFTTPGNNHACRYCSSCSAV